MPTMVGMCCGIAVADNIMDLPDIVKPHMQIIFYNVLTFTTRRSGPRPAT